MDLEAVKQSFEWGKENLERGVENLEDEDIQVLLDEIERYRQAYEYAHKAIYTEKCTLNSQDNSNFEKGKIMGLIKASNILDKAFGIIP